MDLFDKFIHGTIEQADFAKHLQETANGMLESLQELEASVAEQEATAEEKKRKKKQ